MLVGFGLEFLHIPPFHLENRNATSGVCMWGAPKCKLFHSQKASGLKRSRNKPWRARAPQCSLQGDAVGQWGCWLCTKASLPQQEMEYLLLPKGRLLRPGHPTHQIHHDGLKFSSCLRARQWMEDQNIVEGDCIQRRLSARKRIYAPTKTILCPNSLPQNSYWSLAFGISWYRFSLIQIGSRQNSEVSWCPLLNHILMIHWGRLCWKKKKNHYPTFTGLFFFDKNLHALHFLRKWFLQWFLYIKINNFPLI